MKRVPKPRRLGAVTAGAPRLGHHHAAPLRDGLRSLQVETKGLNTQVAAEGGYLVDPKTSERISNVLRAGASTSSPFWRRFRGVLVAGQLAAALILLAGSIMIVRPVSALLAVELGARGERALTMQVTLPYGRYGAVAPVNDFHQRLDASLRALPGVEAVGATSSRPEAARVCPQRLRP